MIAAPRRSDLIGHFAARGATPCRRHRLLSIVPAVLLAACATLPEEAITLSQAVGEDIQQLHAGYRASVRSSFQQMRQAGLAVIDNRWTPIYLQEFIESGRLVQFAQAENTAAVEYWARRAIRDIDAKRREFLDPLDAREQALLISIDEAFSRTINANATVTGFVKSAVRVRNIHDAVADAVGVREVRDTVNNAIIEASDFAARFTRDIEAAARALENGR